MEMMPTTKEQLPTIITRLTELAMVSRISVYFTEKGLKAMFRQLLSKQNVV